MKKAYFELIEKKKVLHSLKDRLFDLYHDVVFTEYNEMALNLIETEENILSDKLRDVNKQLKAIREGQTQDELKKWADEYKARA